MKRAMLIAGGTVGGLGVVLSVTPPELGSNSLSTLSGASAATSEIAPTENTVDAQSTTQTAPTTTKENATSSSKQGSTTKKSTTSTTTTTTNSASSTESNSSSAGVTGSFTGDAVDIGYGLMQVKITVSNGKITEAVAVQTPDGRNQRWTDMAVPQLRSQTLAAQSAAISGVSGASYTAYGWYKSLITALEKAGMPTGV